MIAVTFLSRPAYRLTMIAALIALFIPIIPWIPPGILFTVVYRRLWSLSRMYRAYRDLARLRLNAVPWKTGKENLSQEAFEISGAQQGDTEPQALRYNLAAYSLAIISWIFLLAGIGINVFFIALILFQIQV
jgi:hypothetical protein